ncbi:ATP-binding cassette domain-containing protein [Paenibacillus cisolokensis]|uniref:ATP-binding cassette domain-containing protein n=1 Tax=Paenibacillus cisolokensis TaxID=1658519 RepID=UPI001BCF968A|nr:ATP-binding cassette domain-containing protein [Paenibacillus cisolokensis]
MEKGNFKDIHFSVGAGEIVGITGLVGAGRTELAQALFGIETADEGEIRLHGRKINPRSTTEAVRLGLAYVPESRQTQGLVLTQSITRNLSLSVLNRLTNKLRLIVRKKERQLAESFISKLDIRPALADMQAGQLSGGNQQKVVIGKWLASSPKVLIIDEPTNGIDIGAKTEIHKLLRQLAESGMAIIMISSELPEILSACDRILVMRRGRMVGEFVNDGVTQVDIMNKALLGAPVSSLPEGGASA